MFSRLVEAGMYDVQLLLTTSEKLSPSPISKLLVVAAGQLFVNRSFKDTAKPGQERDIA